MWHVEVDTGCQTAMGAILKALPMPKTLFLANRAALSPSGGRGLLRPSHR